MTNNHGTCDIETCEEAAAYPLELSHKGAFLALCYDHYQVAERAPDTFRSNTTIKQTTDKLEQAVEANHVH